MTRAEKIHKSKLEKIMTIEMWKPAVGWEGLYEVSSLGRVRSVPRKGMTQFGERTYGGVIVVAVATSSGYVAVNLSGSGKRKQRTVHTLVLEAFVGARPEGADACHNNGRRDDPRLLNLRWDSRRSNHADKLAHGTAQVGEKHGNAKLTDAQVARIRIDGLTVAEIRSEFGMSRSSAKRIRSGESWKHVGAA